jgi:hydrogenase expression/formation protein HypE
MNGSAPRLTAHHPAATRRESVLSMHETRISLAHGNGGRFMRELIEELFARHLRNPGLDVQADAVRIELPPGDVMFTTDGFTVQPIEFPGGNIGSLAVHGTVNDLSVAGADPLYLSLNVFIEEGLEVALLERVIRSAAAAAAEAGARIVAGDTKVVRRGEAAGLYLATTGVGVRPSGLALGLAAIKAGDRVLVSGPVGDHGTAVMLAREAFGMRGDLRSDAANVHPLTSALRDLPGLRFMRDPTRGGLATVAHEICRASGLGLRLQEAAIPVNDPVRSVCEILGYDPLYLACEGRVVAVVAAADAEIALQRWIALPAGAGASLIGEVHEGPARVVLHTELGGQRILEELEDDPLPRIC